MLLITLLHKLCFALLSFHRGKELKYLHNQLTLLRCSKISLLIFQIAFLFCFFLWEGSAAATAAAEADRFLKQSIGAEQYGMGGSFVSTARGANALGNNPAGICLAGGNRFIVRAIRSPRTIALLSKQNFEANYEDYQRYEQQESGIETLNWAFPMGKFGTLGLAFSFAQEGPFRRVNHLGKALNNFPKNNLAIGFGYGLDLFGNTGVGFDVKWLRSKVTDAKQTEHVGFGYAYNVGIIHRLNKGFQMGIAARNLSNGLSFSDTAIPDTLHPDIAVGITYHREISNVALRIGLDVHPPFRNGIRANFGVEAWYHGRISGRIGYLRDTEKRYASVLLLEHGTVEMTERVWKAEGMCFGLGMRFGKLTLNTAYIPQFQPTVASDERIHIVQGAAVYTFSIGQDF